MKSLIKTIISISYLIYGLYFIDKQAKIDGLIGVVYSLSAFLFCGTIVYYILWTSSESTSKENKLETSDLKVKKHKKNNKNFINHPVLKQTKGELFTQDIGFVYKVMQNNNSGLTQLWIKQQLSDGTIKEAGATRSTIRYFVPYIGIEDLRSTEEDLHSTDENLYSAFEDLYAAKMERDAHYFEIHDIDTSKANANDIKLPGDDEGKNIGWCAKPNEFAVYRLRKPSGIIRKLQNDGNYN